MPGITLKAIKVSKDFLDSKKLQRAIDNALEGASLAVKVDFDVTTQTWKNRPPFQIEKGPNSRAVFTTDKIYTIVTRGAKPHMIYPRHAKALRFRGKFRPKTKPGAIRSNAGFIGGAVIYARRVRHPGHKARDFDKVIAEKWAQKFPDTMQRAIDAEV